MVGRAVELSAIEEVIEEARRGIAGLSLEGEPGIGKSRLLVAAAEIAAAHGFATASVSADEEIRGTFMLARGIFASDSLRDGASETAIAALDRACQVLSGTDETGLGGLGPEDRLMRVIDQATIALRAAALERPVALLLDDLQWADPDSLRLLRYVVRTQPSLHVFVAIAIRPEESALTQELVTMLADMDRMGVVRRLRVNRFRQAETLELLRQTLAGPVAAATGATIQAQAEGVPFVIEELARTYREAGLLQPIDGSWSLSPKAGRLVPSSVRTLVQRRAAHLKEDTRSVLADAAILGRSFRLADVCALRSELDRSECTTEGVAAVIAPAVEAGLLNVAAEGSGVDFRFSHEQVHEFAAGWLQPARRRAIHGAIVDLLSAGDAPAPAMLPILARHALAAGDVDRAATYSIAAASAALESSAAEEALRLIEDALQVVSAHQPRVALLCLRDDAYDMLRRVDDRLQGLTELTALAEASRDSTLIWQVMLRRAATLRLDEQHDRAAEVAWTVRGFAAEQGDRERELAACMELGQDLLHATLGEGFAPTPLEADLDGAEEAFSRAATIAADLGDQPRLAAASRELGVISVARVRGWFIDQIKAGAHVDILRHVAGGGDLNTVLATLPIMPVVSQAEQRLQKALELFEKLGDRRGAMSTIIAMAYMKWAPDLHVGASPARRIEEVRRLAGRLRSLSRESERAAAEAQMLYGVHVFCRAKVIPDLAAVRGREAHEHARTIGDRSLEFLAAGGTAAAYLDIGNVEEAKRWLDRAAAITASSPTPVRARQLEQWRAELAAAHHDAAGMRSHYVQALEMSSRSDRRAARSEILAAFALATARLLGDTDVGGALDQDLIDAAVVHAQEAKTLVAELPGHPPWGAQADAALAIFALARGDRASALTLARAALATRDEAMREDPHLEILLPAAAVVLELGDAPEVANIRDEVKLQQALIGQRTLRRRCPRPMVPRTGGRALSVLAGPFVAAPAAVAAESENAIPDDERRMLGLLIEGRTNGEIAKELGIGEPAVGQALAAMYARIGATSRADATVFALSGLG